MFSFIHFTFKSFHRDQIIHLVFMVFAILSLAIIDSSVLAQTPDELSDRARKVIENRVKSGTNAGIIVGIVGKGGTKYVTAGKARDKGEAQINPNTIFEIGSITKVFTGILLAEAVRLGEVKLEDPMIKYLPPNTKIISPAARKITLLDLATHTAGLPTVPDNFNPKDPKSPYVDYTEKDLFEYLARAQKAGQTRGQFQYSNLGVGMLGYILARQAGKDYDTLVQERICVPLKMKDTRVHLDDEQKKRLAAGHNAAGKSTPPWQFDVLAGCGALKSTARDMLTFLSANMGLVFLPLTKAMGQARTPHRNGPGQSRVGLGWFIINAHKKTYLIHDGGTGGFRSFMGFSPEDRTGVVVLSNTSTDISDIGFHLLNSKFPLRQPRKAITLDNKILETYVGAYKVLPGTFVKPGTIIVITLTEQGLTYREGNGKPSLIQPLSETEFFMKDVYDLKIEFDRNGKGRAVGMTIFAGAMELKAQKIEK